jgi:tetratricopeptide (TPR) repeat protein
MRSTILLVVVIIFGAYEGACQETVFGLLKKNEKMADRYFEERNFQEALNFFQAAARKNPRDYELRLKIARCHYFLKQYPKASDSYEQYLKAG